MRQRVIYFLPIIEQNLESVPRVTWYYDEVAGGGGSVGPEKRIMRIQLCTVFSEGHKF